MKMIIVVALALVAVVSAAPPVPIQELIEILRSSFEQQPDGQFVSSFETANGINQQATGELREVPDEENKLHNVIVIRGSYSYNDPEGKPVSISYYADETGYHAEGDSIPKLPSPARR